MLPAPTLALRLCLCLAALAIPAIVVWPGIASAATAMSEKEAFEAAKALGTVEAWDAFLSNYPSGFHADLARAYLKTLSAGSGAPPVQGAAPTISAAPSPVPSGEFPFAAGSWGGVLRDGPGQHFRKFASVQEGEPVTLCSRVRMFRKAASPGSRSSRRRDRPVINGAASSAPSAPSNRVFSRSARPAPRAKTAVNHLARTTVGHKPAATPPCCLTNKSPKMQPAREKTPMRIQRIAQSALLALIVLFGGGLQTAQADSGSVVLTIFKGGWIIGGSAGHGTLKFGGKTYPLSVGGLDYGLVFGGSKTVLRGSVKQYQARLGYRRGLCRGGGGPRRRRRRPRDRSHQPEGRGATAFRQAGRPDGECRPQRPGDHDELTGQDFRVGGSRPSRRGYKSPLQ